MKGFHKVGAATDEILNLVLTDLYQEFEKEHGIPVNVWGSYPEDQWFRHMAPRSERL